jgi:hypothetical protein
VAGAAAVRRAVALGLTAALCVSLLSLLPALAGEPSPTDEPRTPIYGEDGEIEIWRLPALAVEDTFGVRLRYELRTVEIQAKRLTLRDILKRAQDGEQRRREAVEDLTYTEQGRIALIGGRVRFSDRRRFLEERSRVYWKRPDRNLRVQLARREYGDQDESDEAEVKARVEIHAHDALDFAQAPFYLEDLDSYRYAIRDRRLFPDRVVYEVAFEPRSEFDVLPHGTFWLDAADFVVVHEEMSFKRNPVPLLLRSVDQIVRERRRIEGHWVVTRLQVVAEMRLTLILGFRRAEFELLFSDFAFNTGLDDSIFERKSDER